jgi:UDP-N-acetylmuramyl pentapeptide phosphotransferase/UDP-N-acetylglucosamine-1-phosphate transferase
MKGFGGLVLLVLVVGTILRFWVWIALAVAVVLLGIALWKSTGWLDRSLDARALRRRAAADKIAAIAHRAEVQNAQVLAGDDRGIYGEYPPKQIA